MANIGDTGPSMGGEANNVADNLSIGPQSLTVTHQLRLITVDQGKHNTRIS